MAFRFSINLLSDRFNSKFLISVWYWVKKYFRPHSSSITQAHARTPTSPLKYRSRSRSPRPRYRHSPHHDRSISPYRSHRRPYSPYEHDRLSPFRDFRPSDERQRSLYRHRRYDERSSRSPNARERSPSRWSDPKHRTHSQSPLRERDAISDRAYRSPPGAPSRNSTDEYKPRARKETLGSSNRSRHPCESRLPNSRIKYSFIRLINLFVDSLISFSDSV